MSFIDLQPTTRQAIKLGLDAAYQYALIRQQQYDRFGPIAPVTRKPALCIPRTSWECPRDIARALRGQHEALRVIYDPLTRRRDETPDRGLHLYNVEFDDRYPGQEFLILQKSLQYDMTAPWPHGGPRGVGWWLVEYVKRTHKRHQPYNDPDRNDRHIADQMLRDNIELAEQQDNQIIQVAHDVHADIVDPYLNRGRNLVSMYGEHHNRVVGGRRR